MKIENKNKRKAMSNWLEKTGNGARRKYGEVTAKTREYMRYKPYGDLQAHGDMAKHTN